MSSQAVLARMDQRVSELEAGFEGFVGAFCNSGRFGGPSRYFHEKTIERRRHHSSVASLVADDLIFDHLYATLTAWGVDRVGPRKAGLRELPEIRESIRAEAASLDALRNLRITEIPAASRASVIDRVWSILARLQVSTARAQIVANSKTLHHLLPDLVPPIDRHYTFWFFYKRTVLNLDERTAFQEMYERLLHIGSSQRETIEALAGKGWNTSLAKVVDNAVMGYRLTHEPPAGRRRKRRKEVVARGTVLVGSESPTPALGESRKPTCREEILAAARSLVSRSGRNVFSMLDVLAEMRQRGTSYRKVTIRTHMAGHMCAEAPSRQGGRPPDLRRVGRGLYALIDWPR